MLGLVIGVAAVLVATTDEQFLSATVTGTTSNWFTTNNRQLTDGTFFNDTQASSGARVAVVGSSIARVLFGSSTAAVGQKIKVNYRPFTVLGVMKDYGQNLNNNVVVPMTVAKAAVFGFRGPGG